MCRRMPKGALMSGFEKPPKPAPPAGKGAGRVRSGRRVGLVLRKAVKSGLRQQPPQKEGRIVRHCQNLVLESDVATMQLHTPGYVAVVIASYQCAQALGTAGFRLDFNRDKVARRADEEVLFQRGIFPCQCAA